VERQVGLLASRKGNFKALEVNKSPKCRVVLITGCSPGGLGPETAKAIRLTSADIYITNRDINKG
jgi:NADP-dependent 3-hydroxy acid dehydrogenase YdfG